MAERKLVDLEMLTRYHGKSLAEIYEIMGKAEEVAVSDTAPTNSGAKLWVDTSGGSEISVPEIKDNATSTTDTWSSSKINSAITATVNTTVEEKVDSKVNTKIDEKLEQNIADTSDVDALFGGDGI